MQSTLKTPAPAMRPKVGRPPVAVVLDHPMASQLRKRKEQGKNRFDPRFAALAVALVALIALTLGALLTPVLVPSPPPLPAPAAPAVSEKGERGTLVGDFAVMNHQENAVTYSAQPAEGISDKDRERLLNILRKE